MKKHICLVSLLFQKHNATDIHSLSLSVSLIDTESTHWLPQWEQKSNLMLAQNVEKHNTTPIHYLSTLSKNVY